MTLLQVNSVLLVSVFFCDECLCYWGSAFDSGEGICLYWMPLLVESAFDYVYCIWLWWVHLIMVNAFFCGECLFIVSWAFVSSWWMPLLVSECIFLSRKGICSECCLNINALNILVPHGTKLVQNNGKIILVEKCQRCKVWLYYYLLDASYSERHLYHYLSHHLSHSDTYRVPNVPSANQNQWKLSGPNADTGYKPASGCGVNWPAATL